MEVWFYRPVYRSDHFEIGKGMTTRGKIDLVGHVRTPWQDVLPDKPITNIIIKTTEPEKKWIEESMSSIGDWRATFRSTYVRWALCINGLFVSKAKYSDPLWAQQNQFTISSLRVEDDIPALKVIAQWDGPTTAQACEKTVPMLAAWGVIDMYACLEEIVFSLYKIFLNHHPEILLQDKAHKPLKKLWRESRIDQTKLPQWESEWGQRLTDWQKKKVFEGLKKIFLAYFNHASLQKPSQYRHTTETEWAETIEGIAYLRHALVHGATQVPRELADFSKKRHAMTFNFIEGTPIIVELLHLQGIELFCDQFLNALNQSLAERMLGKPLTAI